MNKDHIPLSISLNQARIGFAPKDIFVGMSCFSIWDLVLKGGCFICTSKRFAREREREKYQERFLQNSNLWSEADSRQFWREIQHNYSVVANWEKNFGAALMKPVISLAPSLWSKQVATEWTEGFGLVVIGGDSQSEGCEFESWYRILDGHFSHQFVVKFVLFV